MMKKIIHARVAVKIDSIETFKKAAQTMLAATRAEAGCISYELFADEGVAGQFLFVEQWKDQAAIDDHFAANHFKDFGQILAQVSSAPLRVAIFTVSEETTV